MILITNSTIKCRNRYNACKKLYEQRFQHEIEHLIAQQATGYDAARLNRFVFEFNRKFLFFFSYHLWKYVHTYIFMEVCTYINIILPLFLTLFSVTLFSRTGIYASLLFGRLCIVSVKLSIHNVIFSV